MSDPIHRAIASRLPAFARSKRRRASIAARVVDRRRAKP
jgi:hypothetical protein